MRVPVSLLSLVLVACGGTVTPDAGSDASIDAGARDAGQGTRGRGTRG